MNGSHYRSSCSCDKFTSECARSTTLNANTSVHASFSINLIWIQLKIELQRSHHIKHNIIILYSLFEFILLLFSYLARSRPVILFELFSSSCTTHALKCASQQRWFTTTALSGSKQCALCTFVDLSAALVGMQLCIIIHIIRHIKSLNYYTSKLNHW